MSLTPHGLTTPTIFRISEHNTLDTTRYLIVVAGVHYNKHSHGRHTNPLWGSGPSETATIGAGQTENVVDNRRDGEGPKSMYVLHHENAF